MKFILLCSFFVLVFLASCDNQTKIQDKNIGKTQQVQSKKADIDIRLEIAAPKTPEQALEDFYRYLNAGKYAEAYFLWEDSGKASKHDYPTFKKGYESLSKSDYKITGEKTLRNTLGIIFVEIPVEVVLTKKDNSVLSYTGQYTFIQSGTGEIVTAENSYWLILKDKFKKKENK